MKKFSFLLFISFFSFSLFCEEVILLPPVTSYIKVAEHRIIIDEDTIEKLNVQNLVQLLEANGIQLLEYGAYGLEAKPSIRGFTDETVRVILDGVCVNNAQYGTFDFTSIDINDIESVEIVRGGFTEGVKDDGAVGGVIYITTKKQTLGHHFNTDSAIKTFFYYKNPVDTFSQSLGYNGQISQNTFLQAHLKGVYANNKYYFKNYAHKWAIRENSKVIDNNGDIKINHYFKDGSNLSIGDLFYAGNKQTPGPETSVTPGNQKDINNKLIINHLSPDFMKVCKLENTFAYLKDYRNYTDISEDSTHKIDTIKYSCQGDFFEFPINDFFSMSDNIGFNVEYVFLRSTNDGNHNQLSLALKECSKFYFGQHFSLSVPLTIKYCGNNFAFTPKIGFKLSFTDFSIILDGYQMTQFPNMDDLYWIGEGASGNPDLLPENGVGLDLGFNYENEVCPLSFTIFSNYYDQKIQWANSNGIYRPENIASAFYLGCDVDFKKSFFDDFWTISGTGEYLYTRLLDKSNELTYGKKIMYTPDFTGGLNSILNFDFMTFTTQISYVGKRYKSNLNAGYLKPYVLINLSAQFTKWEHLSPYIRINNLLNTDYKSVPEYPTEGISLTIGISTNYVN